MKTDTFYYILYDGDCSFCNHWVQWVLKNDRKDKFQFAPLQSDFGQKFLKDHNLDHKNLDTIYLWKPDAFFLIKSQAIFKIGKILGGKHALLSYMNIFPDFISDIVYDIIAKNRKKLGGKCRILTAEERKKFIE